MTSNVGNATSVMTSNVGRNVSVETLNVGRNVSVETEFRSMNQANNNLCMSTVRCLGCYLAIGDVSFLCGFSRARAYTAHPATTGVKTTIKLHKNWHIRTPPEEFYNLLTMSNIRRLDIVEVVDSSSTTPTILHQAKPLETSSFPTVFLFSG